MAAFVGDGSFHLKPAFDLAARDLYKMMGAGEVNEDFTALVLYFTDATYEEIVKNSRLVDESTSRQEQAFERVNKILQTRRVQRNPLVPGRMKGSGLPALAVSHELTQTEQLLNYRTSIPAMTPKCWRKSTTAKRDRFAPAIHGKARETCFLLDPAARTPVLHAPKKSCC